MQNQTFDICKKIEYKLKNLLWVSSHGGNVWSKYFNIFKFIFNLKFENLMIQTCLQNLTCDICKKLDM